MKVYLLKRDDGSVCVMRMLIDSTVEHELSKWPEVERVKVVSWREIPEDGIPEDRTSRHAWCDVTPEPKIDIDLAKASPESPKQ